MERRQKNKRKKCEITVAGKLKKRKENEDRTTRENESVSKRVTL